MVRKSTANRQPKTKPKRPKLGGYLRIIPSSSRDTPLVVELTSPLVRIGRDPSLEVPLDDPLVADIHVQISHEGGQHVATAVGRLGFMANSRSVTRCRLKPGDRLRIGSTDIYYERRRTPPGRRAPAATSTTAQLAAASQVVLGGAAMGPVLQALLDTFVSMTQADTGFLVLFAQGQPQIHLGRNRHGETLSGAILQLSDSIIHTVAQTRESLLIPNVWASNYKNASSVVRLGLTSAFCLPLPESTHLVGVLYAGQTTGPPLNPACLAPTRILATQIAVLVRNALLTGALQLERPDVAVEPASPQGCQLLGKYPAIREIRRDIERIARTRVPVLIVGEPGTGKTLAARELYRLSQRQQPLIRIHAHELPHDPLFWSRITFGTLPPDLMLLIEDIETLPAELHSPLRELALAQSSLRLVTTSALKQHELREQLGTKLYTELSPACIELPPLRSRGTDVLILAEHFRKQARGIGRLAGDFAPDAIALLKAYDWPGNVVELTQCISRAVGLCSDAAVGADALGLEPHPRVLSLRAAQQQFNQQYVSDVLERVDGRREEAARLLGVSLRTFYRLLNEPQGPKKP